MIKFNEVSLIKIATTASVARDVTKDAGRVRYGSGSIHYSDATPVREATKDAGRVRFGSGSIQF